MDHQQHPLRAYPEVERVDYLSVVASLAAADGTVTDDEVNRIREFCEHARIGDIGIGLIIAAIENPAVIELDVVLPRLAQTELRFTLLLDMLALAHADGLCCADEQAEIQKIAAMLAITPAHMEAANRYVEAMMAASRNPSRRSGAEWQRVGAEIADALNAAGVPLRAVALAGAMMGTGASSGLAALRAGMGIASEDAAAVSLNARSYSGVRRLCQKLFGFTF